jgi:hypothetical protein
VKSVSFLRISTPFIVADNVVVVVVVVVVAAAVATAYSSSF